MLSRSSSPTQPEVNNVRPILVCVFICIGAFIFGWDTACISGALVMEDFEARFGVMQADGSYALGATRESLIVSFLSIGTFLGSLLQSYTTDKLGRKWSICLWSAIFTVGGVIQTACFYSIWQLLIGRLVAGLGVGALSALVTLFAGEVAPKHLRGPLLTMYTVMNTCGIFLAYIVSLGTSYFSSSASWRVPVGLQVPLGLVLTVGIMWIPDSPRRLLYLGREEEARKAIAFINGIPETAGQVDELIVELQIGIAKENEGGQAGWLDLFGPEVRSRVIHGMMLQTFQQFSGQNFYYYFSGTFFESTGTGLSPWEIQAVMGGVVLAFVPCALWVIDHLGRRKGLMIGGGVQAVCAFVAALAGHFLMAPQGTPEDQLTSRNRTGGSIMVAFALTHLAAYSGISGSIPWTVLGESFPTRIRAKAVSIGTAANWLWNFIIAFFTPRIVNRIGPLILLIFSGMLVLQILYTYFFLRETRGLSLEEVDEMYRAHVKPWRSSSWQPSSGRPRGGLALAPAVTTSSGKTLTGSSEKVVEVFGSHSIGKKDKLSGERRSLDTVDSV
ncbi:hypothetical protein JCM6882_004072 [Rhodosporidiobolus microsporus]